MSALVGHRVCPQISSLDYSMDFDHT